MAKNYITFELLQAIQYSVVVQFNDIVTKADFDILRKITPKRFELPIKNHDNFKLIIGDKLSSNRLNDRSFIKAGVYIFTNKYNGNKYVGSSTQLANRLLDNYLVIN